MGAYQVVLTPYALSDLEQIVKHIAQDNPEAAQRLGNKLGDRAFTLEQALVCQSGVRIAKYPGVRKLIEGNYLIIYRISIEQKEVRILRFWHGARERTALDLGESPL